MKVYGAKKASVALLSGLAVFVLSGSLFGRNMFRKVNDFDGDGKADFAITRNERGVKYWYIWQSTGGFRSFQFGVSSDIETAGDYDDDAKTDFAVSRSSFPHGYVAYVYPSTTNTFYDKSFYSGPALISIEPIQQDYDGDGKTDTSYIFITGGGAVNKNIWVYDSSHPVPGDYTRFSVNNAQFFLRVGDLTGDGKADIVTLNPANNYVSVTNYATRTSYTAQFGTSGDQFVPADFDGDGKGDLAVFRESDGTWWWIRSSDNVINAAQFGQAGDKIIPADYDGDGKTDLAIWRDGVYWVMGSQNGLSVFNWGLPTDKPVAY